ncbi:adenylate/guanylate cyclase domain-containing protein [Pseudooceanicola sp.]|uniref:adenylate/guanylate cyclase domain-containing protein n=1 Tax=Pseudooceanicola sp. TaxID=1914328 RepID=UPI0035139968
MSALWRGNWATRLRIASGLVLFAFVLTHFLNIGLGLFSSDLMQRAQDWRQVVTRSLPGGLVLYAALLVHAGLALTRLARRNTLKMPAWEAVQIALGLVIPLLLLPHVIYTRAAHQLYAVDDSPAYLIGLIFGTPDAWLQSLLLLIVWAHGCMGLHFWLRGTAWWQRANPVLIALSVLVPGFALTGFLTEGRRVALALADAAQRAELMGVVNWPDSAAFAGLARIETALTVVLWMILALVAAVYLLRKLLIRRKSVRIHYVDGPAVTAPRGPTLLEMSRANGVPHTSLCGGRGRCTTCRVVIEAGADSLPPPDEAELRSLRAVGAAPGTRLACRIRPTGPLTVFRVFRPDGKRSRAHASQGKEQRLAILFLDIRGFTARTTGQLPYDVVFLLNRFFDAIVPAISGTGGSVDKYLGDGLLAVFETGNETASARAALRAVAQIGAALERFNRMLTEEGAPRLRIGVGVHLGELVLGELGAAGHAPRTIIGETVNAASRLEAMTKEVGVEVLVSDAVLEAAGIETAPLDLVTLDLRGVRAQVRALALRRATGIDALLAVPA